jgi:polyisoprenoid-binding protein YceI
MSTHVRYVMDTKASQFIAHAFASGLVAVAAHNPKFAIRDFEGEARFIPETIGDAWLRVKIRPSSLEIMDEVSATDRREIERVMFQEALESDLFREISFESSQISAAKVSENLFQARVAGELTLHGVTQHHNFNAQVVVGEDTLRAYGDFTVKQTAYGIRIASVAGGTLKMKDEVRLSFFIVARK